MITLYIIFSTFRSRLDVGLNVIKIFKSEEDSNELLLKYKNGNIKVVDYNGKCFLIIL